MNAPYEYTSDEERQYFLFLDALRESGVTNMFGAGPYLADHFDLSRSEANEVLGKWMTTFTQRHPA